MKELEKKCRGRNNKFLEILWSITCLKTPIYHNGKEDFYYEECPEIFSNDFMNKNCLRLCTLNE